MRTETGDLPNKHTIEMGELIRKAREEIGMTQEELADKTYRKKLAVHQMETGKVEINAWTIPYLAIALKKPITYFYPKWDKGFDPREGELSDLEKELILHIRDFESDRLRKLLINFAKLISEYDPRKDAARIFFEITGNRDFSAELFFDNYLKDFEEDEK
ncbi:MAG: helix-turn-helix transcriptional regulator [Bacteroidales bacterium]|nr:helix-turn-helix transcriptional regulator [Bacteroidales bacterium]